AFHSLVASKIQKHERHTDCPTTSANSASKSADKTSVACFFSRASRRRDGKPLQSVPETSVLVSMTSFTHGAFGPDFVHNLLDLVHRHLLAGNRTDFSSHLKKIAGILIATHLTRNQPTQICWIKH